MMRKNPLNKGHIIVRQKGAFNNEQNVISVDGLSGSITFSSNDGTVTIGKSGRNIDFSATGGGGGGGGTETGEIVTTGSTINIASVTPGEPYNVIIRKITGSNTTVNLPSPNAAAPWGRVNIKDGKGDAATHNITVIGSIDNASSFIMNIGYQGQSFLDDGTAWNVQN